MLLGGRERNHPALEGQGTWAEVQLAEGYGWYETGRSGSMLYFDRSEDLTEEYADQVPAAEDPQRIAESVAQRAAEQHAEAGVPGPEWTLISTPEDYGEDFYRLDVLGLADDSQAGYRLFVTAEPMRASTLTSRVNSSRTASFPKRGDIRGINQMAQEQGEPVEVLAAPPHGPGPHEDLEVVGELTSEDQVRLGGREVRAAYADGSWVEVELADGYGWVQGHMLEGAVDPEGNPINLTYCAAF